MAAIIRPATAAERALVAGEKLVLVATFTVVLVINVAQIFSRMLSLGAQLGRWTDLMTILLPWMGMIGAALAVQMGRHVGFTTLRARLPRAVRTVTDALAALSTLALFVVLAVSGFGIVQEEFERAGASPGLEIPLWVPALAVPVGAALMAFHLLVGLGRRYAERAAQ